jgi:hypothetical protein
VLLLLATVFAASAHGLLRSLFEPEGRTLAMVAMTLIAMVPCLAGFIRGLRSEPLRILHAIIPASVLWHFIVHPAPTHWLPMLLPALLNTWPALYIVGNYSGRTATAGSIRTAR